MATDIAACRAKLARTNEYLADFSTSSQAWVAAEADKIVHDCDTDTGKYLIVLKKAPVTPSRLAIVIASDCPNAGNIAHSGNAPQSRDQQPVCA